MQSPLFLDVWIAKEAANSILSSPVAITQALKVTKMNS